MVERLQVYIPKVAENLLRIVVDPKGDFVHYQDYARLQEQVERLEAERGHWIAENRRNLRARQDAAYKIEALEAERDRLRELLKQARTALGRRFPKLSARIDAALQRSPTGGLIE